MSRESVSQDYDNQNGGHGDNDTGVKRARVSQACEPCRARRSKCDGHRPSCAVCQSHRQRCSYDPNPKKRGVPSGSSSALERKAVLLELIVAFLSEHVRDYEQLVAEFLCDQDQSQVRNDILMEKAKPLLENWRQSRSFESVHALAMDPSSMESFWQSLVGYGKSLSLPNNIERVDVKEGTVSSGYSVRRNRAAPEEASSMQETCHSSQERNCALPNDAERYLDIYFATTHTWLPMVDRYRLISFVKQYSGSKLPPTRSLSETAVLCLLWAIVAQVSSQYLESSQDEQDPVEFGLKAFRIARSFISTEDASVRMEYVQALILLSLYQFSLRAWRSSWILITLAGRPPLDPQSPSRWWHDKPMTSTQIRTFLACSTVESFITICLDFPSETSSLWPLTDWSVGREASLELEEIGWEEWESRICSSPEDMTTTEPLRALSAFNRMTRLTHLVTKRLSVARQTHNPLEKSRLYLAAQEDLLEWRSTTERHYPHLGFNEVRTPPPHILLLELAYWTHHCVLDLRFAAESATANSQAISPLKVEELVKRYRQHYGLRSGSLVILTSLVVTQRLLGDVSRTGQSVKQLLDEFQGTGEKTNLTGYGGTDASSISSDNRAATSLARSALFQNCGVEEPGPRNAQTQSTMQQEIFEGTLPQLAPNTDSQRHTGIMQVTGLQLVEQTGLGKNALPLSIVNKELKTTRHESNSPSGPTATYDTEFALPNTLVQDDMLLPEHNLAYLDAVDWNDDFFTRNLGYLPELD